MTTFTEADAPEVPAVRLDGFAWPLLMIFLLIAGTLASVSAAAIAGIIPLWAGLMVNTVMLYLMAHINHEAVHRNISGKGNRLTFLNDAIGHIGSFWVFLPYPAFRAVHFAHHRSTNDPLLDGDMWFARKSPLAIAAACTSILVGYEIALWRLYRRKMITAMDMGVIIASRLLFVALVGAAFVVGYGREVMMLWIIPALLVMPVLAFLFAFIVHHPHTDRQKEKASNVWLSHNPLIQRLLTMVFVFQNYHLIHHLNARIPFYRYGEYFRKDRAKLEQAGAAIKYVD